MSLLLRERLTRLPVPDLHGSHTLTDAEAAQLLRDAEVCSRMMLTTHKADGTAIITRMPKSNVYVAAALALLAGRFHRPEGAAKRYNIKAAVTAVMRGAPTKQKIEPKHVETRLQELIELDAALARHADSDEKRTDASAEFDKEHALLEAGGTARQARTAAKRKDDELFRKPGVKPDLEFKRQVFAAFMPAHARTLAKHLCQAPAPTPSASPSLALTETALERAVRGPRPEKSAVEARVASWANATAVRLLVP